MPRPSLAALLARHPWQLAVGAGAVGLATAPHGALAAAGAAAAFGAAGLAAGGARPALRFAALLAGIVLLGALAGRARLVAIDSDGARIVQGASLAASVHVVTHPRPSPFGSSAEVVVADGRLRGARLLARIPRWVRWPRLALGSELRLEGGLRRLRRGRPFTEYLRRRGVASELLVDEARHTGDRRDGLIGAIDRMRERSERALAAGMPAAEANLARGMVLGQDEAIPEPTREDFRASGLAHLLAVSGQNVMLLVALALPLLAAAGLATRGRAAGLLALIALYVPLAGAGPSLQRAGVMGAAGIAALAASRPASRTYALLLAAVATLALNPRASADPGWQLSFAAVAGIIWLAPPLQRALREGAEALGPAKKRALPVAAGHRALADGAAITLAATLATAPLLAHHFGSVPLAGLAANLLALPLVAPAMWLGMLAAALAQGAALGPPLAAPAAGLAELAARLGTLPVAAIAWLAERFADLPGGQLMLPLGSPLALAIAYGLLVAAAMFGRRVAGRLGPRALESAARWRRLPRARRAGVVALAAAAILLTGARSLTPPAPPERLTVSFLDVGQGDATLIQHPDGTAILFDGGPPEAGTAALLRKAGVRRLALVVATHASRDHHGGLPEVLERIPTDLLLDGGDGSTDASFRAVIAAAKRHGVRTLAASAPLTLRAGSMSVRVLSPPPRASGPPPDDPNPRAVTAIVSAGGFDLFLSADAESDALAGLPLPDVDAMKVPHHGSSDPGLPDVLERLRPEVAAIEVGPNTYGHPTASTLGALRAAGVRSYRTDRHGTVTLTPTSAGPAVETER